MGAITSLAQLNAACRPPVTFGTNAILGASSSVTTSLLNFGDLFRQASPDGFKSAGSLVAVGASASLTSSTTGAMPIPSVASGQSLYVSGVEHMANSNIPENFNGVILLVDMLTQQGFDPTITTLQTLSAVSLPRTPGTCVEMWLFFPGVTSTASDMTVNYVNSAGSAKSVVISIPTNYAGFRASCCPLWFDANDSVGGCNSITSVQLSVALSAAGAWNLVLARRLASAPLMSMNISGGFSCFASLGIPKIYDFGASKPCLSLFVQNTGSASSWCQGQIQYAVN